MSLLTRLAWRSLRHRPWQALLLLFALSLSTTALTLALAVTETADGAWDRVFETTNGAHVTLKANYADDISPAVREQVRMEQFAAQSSAPGVVAASGPWPLLFTTGEVGSAGMELRLQVREAVSTLVDQPLLVSGQWLDGGDGVVLEDGLATTMRVGPGDTVTLAGQRLPVRGTAITMGIFRFPKEDPAFVWVSPTAAARLDPGMVEYGYDWIDLRLANSVDAATFVPTGTPSSDLVDWDVETWQGRRAYNAHELEDLGTTLLIAGIMLAGLTISTAAVLVGWRMAAQTRQVGTLKAVGVAPWQVTGALLVEYLAVASLATAVGLAGGTLVAPLLARSVRTLYGAPQAPPITWPRAVVVATVALAVVLLATVRPALRGARHSTLRSLTAAVRPPRRSSRLAQLADRVGLPLLTGLAVRAALRRPGRTLAATFSTALGIAAVTAGLTLDRRVREFQVLVSTTDLGDLNKAELFGEIRAVVIVAAALLTALAAVNAVVTAMFAARDTARNHAILRAVGATPGQSVTALVIAQLGACLLACIIGIPLGVALLAAAGAGLAPLPPPTYLAVVVAGTALYALIVSIPALLLARAAIAPALTYE